jgi:3-oxoacyl-[acyl-carrier-protein] synthase III
VKNALNGVKHVGIRAMSVAFPDEVRDNSYWRVHHPELLAAAEQATLSRIWSADASNAESAEFDDEMRPYLADPFRGTVERRILAAGEGALVLERKAARDALAAAGVAPGDVDALIVGSFLPDQIGTGNAAFLARDLGLRGAAWNIESACATAMPALVSACALVRDGTFRNALVVVSCTYSRVTDPTDSLSWFMGDGAGAWLVGPVASGQGLLGAHLVHSGETCGTAWYEPVPATPGRFAAMYSGAGAGRTFRDTGKATLVTCCRGAVERAGVSLHDIALFAFATPTAWYARFGARCLGIDPERTIDMYRYFGNIGAALPMTNLYYAAAQGRMRADDLVLVYCVGSVSSAGAVVMRWANVALAAPPAHPAVARAR